MRELALAVTRRVNQLSFLFIKDQKCQVSHPVRDLEASLFVLHCCATKILHMGSTGVQLVNKMLNLSVYFIRRHADENMRLHLPVYFELG